MCGDGVTQGDEECDFGPENDENGQCLPTCRVAGCGDGYIEDGVERCEPDIPLAESCESLSFVGEV